MSTVVALDIGSSAIAGVELKTARERVTLAKAAVEPLPPGLVHDGEIVRPEELAGWLGWSLGILDRAEACPAKELVPRFSWEKVRKETWGLTSINELFMLDR